MHGTAQTFAISRRRPHDGATLVAAEDDSGSPGEIERGSIRPRPISGAAMDAASAPAEPMKD